MQFHWVAQARRYLLLDSFSRRQFPSGCSPTPAPPSSTPQRRERLAVAPILWQIGLLRPLLSHKFPVRSSTAISVHGNISIVGISIHFFNTLVPCDRPPVIGDACGHHDSLRCPCGLLNGLFVPKPVFFYNYCRSFVVHRLSGCRTLRPTCLSMAFRGSFLPAPALHGLAILHARWRSMIQINGLVATSQTR